MMDITRENYESWFVDYLEGNLEEGVVDRFIEFLQENPDLKEELKLFESVSAVPEDLTFASKNKLYKSKYDLEEEFNKTAIAEIEGDLNEVDKATFGKYLSTHPEKQKERDLFEKTILQADENIRFEKKDKLYKKSGRKELLLWTGRVAAILILAIAIFSLFERAPESVVPEDQIVSKSEFANGDFKEPEIQVQTETPKEKVIPEAVKERNQILPKKEIITITVNDQEIIFEEDLALERIKLEVPEMMNSLTASINVYEPRVRMGTMTLVYPENTADEERFLADNLRGKVNLRKISRAGLNLVANLSNERFTYETNSEGQVTEYNYDSRLLAFSFPASHSTTAE